MKSPLWFNQLNSPQQQVHLKKNTHMTLTTRTNTNAQCRMSKNMSILFDVECFGLRPGIVFAFGQNNQKLLRTWQDVGFGGQEHTGFERIF